MNRTPIKYSTPSSTKSHFSKDTEPSTPSTPAKSPNSNNYYSVLRMISNFIFTQTPNILQILKEKDLG